MFNNDKFPNLSRYFKDKINFYAALRYLVMSFGYYEWLRNNLINSQINNHMRKLQTAAVLELPEISMDS